MPKKNPTIYEAAMRQGNTSSFGGKLTLVALSGEGCILLPTADWLAVQKWGNSKESTGSPRRDRQMLFDRIEYCAARPGSFIATRGGSRQLLHLVKMIKDASMEVSEWSLPPGIRDGIDPNEPVVRAQKEGAEEAPEESDSGTDEAVEPKN